jgi:hypothetical protein
MNQFPGHSRLTYTRDGDCGTPEPTATVAAIIAFSATAHADNHHVQFASPSGNIRCTGSSIGTWVVCEIHDYTYVVPQADMTGCQDGRFPLGNVVEIDAESGTDWTCPGPEFDSGPWPSLDYGRKLTLGGITCGSESSGMTCTSSSRGFFFHLSRDSYQLG